MTPTINIDEIKSEFGTWLGQNQSQIRTLILQKTESTDQMTRIIQDEDFRASKATIDHLVQGFQKKWTPKGNATFTPITIIHRRHKVDVEFYPDEIMGSWLGFMAQEDINREQWPISRYVFEVLMADKIAEDREMTMYATGEYEEPTEDIAQDTGKSMDGYCTILKTKLLAGTSNINFVTGLGAFTILDIFEQVEKFADGLKQVYKRKPMNVCIAPEWFTAYLRRRRDLYGGNVDYKGMINYLIDGTPLTLTPLAGMAGQNLMFATPKENFIWLTKLNNGISNPTFESYHRMISIHGDWHENVGFAIEEAITCAVSEEEASASE